ncbi:hypothetical protein K432DRAFT_405584 [Lepidopterella palustris CBS 459.81]|uniref:Uncharacterized protein n=1 Tax=Lepidopterella palustris CBS 459.81 TaxID=1314670 RepID=A0A8E2E8M2_9PEZI|nr:hypothetical protein K432DRAFT_405584 [Lepidopterella palustris CBS 459.81]
MASHMYNSSNPQELLQLLMEYRELVTRNRAAEETIIKQNRAAEASLFAQLTIPTPYLPPSASIILNLQDGASDTEPDKKISQRREHAKLSPLLFTRDQPGLLSHCFAKNSRSNSPTNQHSPTPELLPPLSTARAPTPSVRCNPTRPVYTPPSGTLLPLSGVLSPLASPAFTLLTPHEPMSPDYWASYAALKASNMPTPGSYSSPNSRTSQQNNSARVLPSRAARIVAQSKNKRAAEDMVEFEEEMREEWGVGTRAKIVRREDVEVGRGFGQLRRGDESRG